MSTHVRSTSFAKTQITGVVWYLGVRQDVTAAREVHRHSRTKNGRNRQVVLEEDNDVYSCQRGSRTFTATHCNSSFSVDRSYRRLSVAVVVLTIHSLAVLR